MPASSSSRAANEPLKDKLGNELFSPRSAFKSEEEGPR